MPNAVMRTDDPIHERRPGLTAAWWVMIALCAALILFSDNLTGRLGFAALLLLAVIVGRYASARQARLRPPSRAPEAVNEPEEPRRRSGER